MKRKQREVIRYSESFKQQVLTELEQGLTIAKLQMKYGIKGGGTIQGWIRKSGNLALQTRVIRVETPNEKDRIKALEAEIRRLKEAVADIYADRVIAESTLEVLCEEKGWDIEEVKKNAGKRLQQKQSKKK
jgi:transposase-like protein